MTDKRKPKRPAPRPSAAAPKADTPEGDRIAKVMARAGLCSRRDAERWIAEGRVSVNGKALESPAFNVTPSDKIAVDGRPIGPRERTRLFLFHKPRGTVTTDRDPEGRPTIFDAMPEDLPRVVTVGRLDINTEGLLLLTNDGGLARVLELPATGWLRRYRVRAHGEVNQAQLDALAKGVVIEGVEYRGIEAHLDRVQGANVWLTMGLREGKNREIKRVLEHLGLSVNRLIRLSFGPFQLGYLAEGAVEEVKTRVLQDQLGEALAQEAGADFDAPVLDAKARDKIARHFRDDDDEPPARPERDWRDAPKAKRKHVSVLRAERREAGEARRKIERSETADRRGRAVKVERVSVRGEEPKTESRNGRRFAAQRRNAEPGGERPPMRRRAQEGDTRRKAQAGARPARKSFDGDRPARKSFDGERPARKSFDGERPARKSFDGERPARKSFDGERPARKSFDGERPARKSFDGERPARKSFDGERPARKSFDGERPARKSFDGERPARKSFDGERPARKSFDGARPARKSFDGERPARKSFDGERPARKTFDGERPARKRFEGETYAARSSARPGPKRDGDKSFGDRGARGKSFGGKPGGKSFGGKPGGKPGGKSFGGKSFGGKGPGARGSGKPRGDRPGGGGGGRRGRE